MAELCSEIEGDSVDNVIMIRMEPDPELVKACNKIVFEFRQLSQYDVTSSSRYVDVEVAGFTYEYVAEQRKRKRFFLFPCIEVRDALHVYHGFSKKGNERFVSCTVFDERILEISKKYIGEYANKFGAKVEMRLEYEIVNGIRGLKNE